MPQRLTVLFRQRPANRVRLIAAIVCCGLVGPVVSLAEPGPSPIDRSVIQQFVSQSEKPGQSQPDAVTATQTTSVEAAPKVPVVSPVPQPRQSQSNVAAAIPTTPVEAAPEVPAAPTPAQPAASTPTAPTAGLSKTRAVAPPTASMGYAGQPEAMDSALIRQMTGARQDTGAASTEAKSMPQGQMDLIQQVFAPEMVR